MKAFFQRIGSGFWAWLRATLAPTGSILGAAIKWVLAAAAFVTVAWLIIVGTITVFNYFFSEKKHDVPVVTSSEPLKPFVNEKKADEVKSPAPIVTSAPKTEVKKVIEPKPLVPIAAPAEPKKPEPASGDSFADWMDKDRKAAGLPPADEVLKKGFAAYDEYDDKK